jgi:hypothetical protein
MRAQAKSNVLLFRPRAEDFERDRERWQRQVLADKTLRPSSKVVAIAISWHLNRETCNAWPGIRKLMKLTGLARRTVDNALLVLEAAAHVVIDKDYDDYRFYNPANRYLPVLHPEPASEGAAQKEATVASLRQGVASFRQGVASTGRPRTSYITSEEPPNEPQKSDFSNQTMAESLPERDRQAGKKDQPAKEAESNKGLPTQPHAHLGRDPRRAMIEERDAYFRRREAEERERWAREDAEYRARGEEPPFR